jgi:arylsulfatase A-like enzyme
MRNQIARIFLCSLAVVLGWTKPAAAEEPKYNVIIILADDLGYGDLACYGHPKFKTPNLDRMAAEGGRLTHFNTPMAYCAPTRASLMTGRYPFRCGLTANPAPDSGKQYIDLGLPVTEVTLADVFRHGGYATGIIGKWHLGHQPQFLPTRRGFDEYLGIPYSNDMRPVQLLEGEKVVEYPVVQATLTQRYTARALDFLERNRARPFFLYFPEVMPHKPLAVSEKFYRKSGAGLYGDAISELDWSVGQVLDKVKELGLDERTLIIFTSDNGPWFGGSTGGLRGMKSVTWEGGFRVPCIARWPGKIPPGHVSAQPAITMDLFAMTLKAAGLAVPADRVIDGQDIFSLFTSDASSPHEVIFGMQGSKLATISDTRWKLHIVPAREHLEREDQYDDHGRWIDPRGPDGVTILAPYEQYQPTAYPGVKTGEPGKTNQLFDLQNDPAEQHDVANDHPDVVKRLTALFNETRDDKRK